MSPERYERLMQQFDALCDLDDAARAPLLRKLEADDPDLAQALVPLLQHDTPAASSFDLGARRIGGLMKDLVKEATQSGQLELAAPPAPSPEPPASLICERYRVGRWLGTGGSGSVYVAFDERAEQEVAIKFLRAQPMQDARAVSRFRREFRAVSRLDHPGCLKVFAEGIHESHRYIVMEYVRGGDLNRLAGRDPALVIFVLTQLAGTLEYVHSQGIVHRDLKPQNVLLCLSNPVLPKLADFGIAKVFDFDEESSRLSSTGDLVGTIDYLSPEQVQGQAIDPRSDLYALGCLIYKLFAGRPPFLGNTFERLSARVKGGAPALSALAEGFPPALDALVMRLLEPDPARRPQSALEVGAALAEILSAIGPAGPPGPLWLPEQSARAYLYRPSFSGRDALLEEILTEARAAFAGQKQAAALIGVCGEAGLGKSALVKVARQKLEAAGALVFTASVPAQTAGPLSPFPEILARVASASTDSLRPFKATRPHAQDGAAALRGQAAALAERLLQLHERRPLALVLEDLHYTTESAFIFLRTLVRELGASPGPRPFVLATSRPERREDLLALDGTGAPVRMLDLSPLDTPAIADIARSMLGVEKGRLPDLLVAALVRESGGNPLLVQSALLTMADRGGLVRTERGFSFYGHGIKKDPSGAPHVDDPVLVERLGRLSAPTRQIVEAAAVAGLRFDVELLVRIFGRGEDTVMDALDEALRASVIHPVNEQPPRSPDAAGFEVYEFEHMRLVEVLYQGLEPTARRTWHVAIGNELRRRPGYSAASLAHHFSLGEERGAACEYLLAAGLEALQAHDYAAARRFLQDTLGRIDDLPEAARQSARQTAWEGLADAQMLLGEASESVKLLGKLLKEPQTGGDSSDQKRLPRARRLRKLGLARLRAGDTAGALATLEQALEALQDRLPHGRVRLYMRLILDAVLSLLRLLVPRRPTSDAQLIERVLVHRELALLYRWVDDVRTAGHNFAFARSAGKLGAPELLVESYAAVAMFLAFIGSTWLGSWVERRTHLLAISEGDRLGLARIKLMRGGVDLLLRNDPACLEHMNEGVAQYKALADPVGYAWALAFRAWAEILASRFTTASEDCTRALRIAEKLGLTWLQADAGCAQALVDSLQGRFVESEERVRAILASDVRLALPALEAVATEVLGGIGFMTGRYRDASALFERAHLLYVSHHLERGWGFLMQIERTEALLMLADEEGAAAVPGLLQKVRKNARLLVRRLGRLPHYRGSGEVLLGVYHARRGHLEKARRLFDEALRLRPAPRTTYIDGWALWRIAFERRRLGDSVDSVRPLLAEVEQINAATGMRGMSSWLARARPLYDL